MNLIKEHKVLKTIPVALFAVVSTFSLASVNANQTFAQEFDRTEKIYLERLQDVPQKLTFKKDLTPEENQIIEATLAKYQSNIQTAPDVIDQIVVFKNGVKVYDNTTRDGIFYLASTAKVVIMNALADVLKEQNISVNTRFINLSRSNINEAIGSRRFLAMPFLFKDRVDVLGLQIETKKLLSEYMANPSSFSDSQFNQLASKVSTDFQNNTAFTPMPVSFKEVSEMNLIASLNGPVSLVRNYMIYYLADKASPSYPTPKDRYDAGFDMLTARVKAFVPTVELTKSFTGYDLWFQSGPNTANIVEYTSYMDKLIRSANSFRKIPDPFIVSMVESIKNNPYDFGFDLSATDVKDSYDNIYEKTGLYPSVFWPQNLANLGYPPHLSISSIFSLTKDMNQYTFGFSKAVKVSMPPRGSDNLPDEFDPTYTENEIAPKQAIYFQNFRTEAKNLVRQFAE